MSETCPHCGIQLPVVADGFCYSCGQSLETPPAEDSPRTKKKPLLGWEGGIILIVLGISWLIVGLKSLVPNEPGTDLAFLVGWLIGKIAVGLFLVVWGGELAVGRRERVLAEMAKASGNGRLNPAQSTDEGALGRSYGFAGRASGRRSRGFFINVVSAPMRLPRLHGSYPQRPVGGRQAGEPGSSDARYS